MQADQASFEDEFRLLSRTARGQVAAMKLPAGHTVGGPDNSHSGADQWLLVIAGVGYAIVNNQKTPLVPGTLLLIEKEETHEIRNTGEEELHTINFYTPPAYQDEDSRTAAGKPANE